MRYKITIEFEASTEDLAIYAAQNAAEKIVYSDGVKFLRASHKVDVSANPNAESLITLQNLSPNDFSTNGHVQEEVAAYNAMIERPYRTASRVLAYFYNMPYQTALKIFFEDNIRIVNTILGQLETICGELYIEKVNLDYLYREHAPKVAR